MLWSHEGYYCLSVLCLCFLPELLKVNQFCLYVSPQVSDNLSDQDTNMIMEHISESMHANPWQKHVQIRLLATLEATHAVVSTCLNIAVVFAWRIETAYFVSLLLICLRASLEDCL